MTVHVLPTAALAARVLLPGDPGRALRIAKAVLDEPRMFNHHRGLWGYTGIAADGEPMTVQSTGIGGPSAAIVLEELCDLGLQRAIRVGTCTATDATLGLGDLLIVDLALAADGTSRALGAADRVAPDPGLTEALARADGACARGAVASSDLFYATRTPGGPGDRAAAGALAADLQSAAVLRMAERRGVRAACALAVTAAGTERLSEAALHAVEERLGRLAAAALLSDCSR